MTERDRIWQRFLRKQSTREASVWDVTTLCHWWFLYGVRKRNGRTATV